ncbi:hypothetical protein ACSBR1_036813 [Camellia fascicularis]
MWLKNSRRSNPKKASSNLPVYSHSSSSSKRVIFRIPKSQNRRAQSSMATTMATTTTLTLHHSSPSPSSSPQHQQQQSQTLTLRLNRRKKKVTWKEGTVDNEFLQKKSSKKCCIFHKDKPFDEDDSDDDPNDGHDHDHPDACSSTSNGRN